MKYEFHVGDYVAFSNKYDTIHGYVKEYMKLTFSSEHCFVFQWDDGTQTGWSGNIQELPHNFVRIGQYDFTKKGEGKIEPLVKSWILEDADNKGEYHFDSREVIKKINELVEVVNKLGDKND
jgi:hypothetical protein